MRVHEDRDGGPKCTALAMGYTKSFLAPPVHFVPLARHSSHKPLTQRLR
jgi:hypothetical protein